MTKVDVKVLRSSKKRADQKVRDLNKKIKEVTKKAHEKAKAAADKVLKAYLAKLTPVKGQLKSYTRESDKLGKVIKEKTRDKDIMPLKGAIKKVYKKASSIHGYKDVIVTLSIPAHANRYQELNYHGDMYKCRASEAIVVAINDKNTGKALSSAKSNYDKNYVYTVGKVCRPKNDYFAPSHHGACASGIHFFMQRSRAVLY